MDNESKHEILEAISKNSSELREEIMSDKQEVLEAIGLMADQMQGLRSDVDEVKNDVYSLKTKVNSIESHIGRIEGTMVTKDYMEGRLAALAR